MPSVLTHFNSIIKKQNLEGVLGPNGQSVRSFQRGEILKNLTYISPRNDHGRHLLFTSWYAAPHATDEMLRQLKEGVVGITKLNEIKYSFSLVNPADEDDVSSLFNDAGILLQDVVIADPRLTKNYATIECQEAAGAIPVIRQIFKDYGKPYTHRRKNT